MTYQAVIRNASNNLVVNAPVKMKISILQGSASGTAEYSELHNPTTNANGLVSIEIGSGTSPVGAIGSINWGNGTYFLKTETDPTNGTNYSIEGTSQLLSVPYALQANCVSSSLSGDTLLVGCKKYLIPGIKDLNAPPTLDNGLIAYYPFNGNANDESGNGRNGVPNQLTWGRDRFGNSISTAEFNGISERIIRVDNAGISAINNFSFSYWFKVNTPLTFYNHILSTGIGSGIVSSGSIYCQLYGPVPTYITNGVVGKIGFSGYLGFNNSNSKLDDGKWHNGIMIVDWTGGMIKIYVNGVLDAIRKFNPQIAVGWNFIDLGQIRNGYATNPPTETIFPGELDDIRIYNRALTQEEITYLANN
jgi:hypothetical protein